MIGNVRSMVWRTGVMCLLGTACTVLLMGCGSKTPTGTPAPKGPAAGQTAPADLASEPADAVADPADGDTQGGEFEGEHQAGANDEDRDGGDDEDKTDAEGDELTVVLSEGDFRAVVEYEQKAGEASLEVEVTGGQADATIDIAVNGTVVFSLTLDSTGSGEIDLTAAPDELEDQPFPTDFPVLAPGDVVSVGQLTGTLITEEEREDEGTDDDD